MGNIDKTQIFQKLFKSIQWKILLSVSYLSYSPHPHTNIQTEGNIFSGFCPSRISLCKYKQVQIYILTQPPFSHKRWHTENLVLYIVGPMNLKVFMYLAEHTAIY